MTAVTETAVKRTFQEWLELIEAMELCSLKYRLLSLLYAGKLPVAQ